MHPRILTIIFAVASSSACSSVRGPATNPLPASLLGSWEQEAAPAAGSQAFVFRSDSTALWIISTPARRDTFAIRYRVGAAATPLPLDLYGFARGPLQGRTLYCIVDLPTPERFRMDCEPGRSGDRADENRPRTFTDQTVTYRRGPLPSS